MMRSKSFFFHPGVYLPAKLLIKQSLHCSWPLDAKSAAPTEGDLMLNIFHLPSLLIPEFFLQKTIYLEWTGGRLEGGGRGCE